MNGICLHGHVGGRVQGVCFRAFTREQAVAHHVHGYARNLPDGRVEVLLCGNDSDVQAVVAALHRGPPQARVDTVALAPVAWRDCDGFRIE